MGDTCRFCTIQNEVIVAETPNFIAKASFGALLQGWLLIVPRLHMLTLSEMSTDLKQEYDSFVETCTQRLRTLGPVARFEHGPAHAGSSVGCTIDHAHLHLVPTTIDLLSAAKAAEPAYSWKPLAHVTELLPAHEKGLAYLYLRQSDHSVATTAETFPSQFFRRLIAHRLGLAQFDWRLDPQPTAMPATLEFFATYPR